MTQTPTLTPSSSSSPSPSFLMQHLSPEAAALKATLEDFVINECQPAELEYERHLESRHGHQRWTRDAVPPCIERLKSRAKQLGLWNLFLLRHDIPSHLFPPHVHRLIAPRVKLTNVEYGVLCEVMGKSFLAPEACNCSAPDTGNMEVLLQHGTPRQQSAYLRPLLDGSVRSTFLMTEPDVASSDATNIQARLTKIVEKDGGVRYVLNGTKWWSTGAMDPRCRVAIVLARMDYSHPSCAGGGSSSSSSVQQEGSSNRHGSHTVAVLPMSTAGLTCTRPLTVFGYDDAPHGHAEVSLADVPVPPDGLVLGEGRGFEVAQSRLGPGRIHHCMRAVGMAQRCHDLMLGRALTRRTFGRYLSEHGGCQELIADSAADVEAARLLTLSCAAAMDEVGAVRARGKIAMIKMAVPRLTLRVVDRAVQVFGGAGVSGDVPLARILAGLRTLRIADGPDAVHQRTVAMVEIRRARKELGRNGRDDRSRL